MSFIFVLMIGEARVEKRLFGLALKSLGFVFCHFSARRVFSSRFEKITNKK